MRAAWKRSTWDQRLGVLIVLVSFGASAGATVDLALISGIHPWTAWTLPVSMEASIVQSARVWHTKDDRLRLARAACLFFVAVTWVVNFVHGGMGWIGALATMPTLSLLVGLHLAFDVARKRRTAPKPQRKTAPRQASRPETRSKTVVAGALDAETAEIVQRYLDGETGRGVHDTALVQQVQDGLSVSRATAYRRLKPARQPVATNGHSG